jgi:hypothetical protein
MASWTQTFISNAAGFVAQFFPIFLLGALFGKLMDASGSVEAPRVRSCSGGAGAHRAAKRVLRAARCMPEVS